jgi:hypothetical protein
MPSKREIVVSESSPMPKGYAFLRKGNAYKTLHCRKLTHEAGRTLYVVESGKQKVGIRVPRHIFFTVHDLARETAPTRLAATARRDAALNQEAEAELRRLYPTMPAADLDRCLKRAFRKHSRRVGRSGQMAMAKKAELAVMAHIRHQHTDYDQLMKNGMEREEARRKVMKEIFRIRREWGANGDVISISSDSDSEWSPSIS